MWPISSTLFTSEDRDETSNLSSTKKQFALDSQIQESGRALSLIVGDLGATLFDPLYIEDLDGSQTHEADVRRRVSLDSYCTVKNTMVLKACTDDDAAARTDSDMASVWQQDEGEDDDDNLREPPGTSNLIPDLNLDQRECSVSLNNYEIHDLTSKRPEDKHQDGLVNRDLEFNLLLLDAENPVDLLECPPILDEDLMQELRQALPESARHNQWERCFAIGRDGDSMISMLQRTAPYAFTILVGLDTHGHIVGGFCSEPWRTASSASLAAASGIMSPLSCSYGSNGSYMGRRVVPGGYYGTGQSFLFASHPQILPGVDPPRDPNKQLEIYKWTGDNDYCQIITDHGSYNLGGSHEGGLLAMGGKGDFGLIIHNHFLSGETGRSATFGNPPLAPSGHFDLVAFEVYGMVPLFFGTAISFSSTNNRHILSLNAIKDESSQHSSCSSRSSSSSSNLLRSHARFF